MIDACAVKAKPVDRRNAEIVTEKDIHVLLFTRHPDRGTMHASTYLSTEPVTRTLVADYSALHTH